MILTNLQKLKVEEIVNYFQSGIRRVYFNSPTGSGKTLMASHVIANIINQNPDKKLIFIIATISSSDLPVQFAKKINQYKSYLNYSDFEVEYFESPSNNPNYSKDTDIKISPIQNKVYIFGKAAFGKNRLFTEQEVITDFIQEAKQQNYKIIYIRDEAHIGDKKISEKDIKTFESLMNKSADFILKMTATFNITDENIKRVTLSEHDLTNENINDNKWLIKCSLQKLFNDGLTDEELLKHAINTFKKIQAEYKTLDVNIRPAMLIQVDNEPEDPDKKAEFKKIIKMIKDELSLNLLSWVKYFGISDKESSNADNTDFTLDKITRNNDTTDCIIFKIGPATGWDIPRACMLLQLRNVCSASLKTQTIGRIKRNPYPNLEKNTITDKYYIYSNDVKPDPDITVYEHKIKDKFKKEQFALIKIKNKNSDILNKNKVKDEVTKFLESRSNDIYAVYHASFNQNMYRNLEEHIVIYSPILILKRLNIKLGCLNNFQKIVIDQIKSIYKNIQALKNIKEESLLIVLFDHFMKNINDIVQKSLLQNISYELVEEYIHPDVYTNIFENQDIAKRNTDNTYLFDIKKNGVLDNMETLDSANENTVYNRIVAYLELAPGIVKVWAKNQTTSNIYGEYLDDNNHFRTSYFDFIIKYQNGNLLYIEVKGVNDIDDQKTKILASAYESYFESKLNYNLFQNKFIICLLKVDGDTLYPTFFYDKNIIKENYTEYSFPQVLQELRK